MAQLYRAIALVYLMHCCHGWEGGWRVGGGGCVLSRTSWYCICWISSLNTRGYIQRPTAVGAPDGDKQKAMEGQPSPGHWNTVNTFTQPKTNTGGTGGGKCATPTVYSSKLRYQLMTDVSDSADGVRHSRQKSTGMYKLHAGSDRKYFVRWTKSGREKWRVQRDFSVTRAHATNTLKSCLRPNQDSPGWGFFLSRQTECWAQPWTLYPGNSLPFLVAKTGERTRNWLFVLSAITAFFPLGIIGQILQYITLHY